MLTHAFKHNLFPSTGFLIPNMTDHYDGTRANTVGLRF